MNNWSILDYTRVYLQVMYLDLDQITIIGLMLNSRVNSRFPITPDFHIVYYLYPVLF